MGMTTRQQDFENIKRKRNRYPYNLLLETFNNVCGEAQARNLEIMMDILSVKYPYIRVTIDKYKNNMLDKDIAKKYRCNYSNYKNYVNSCVSSAKSLIIKYKDSLFNGFKRSKLCQELRRDFDIIGIPDNIISQLNECGIYSFYLMCKMDKVQFVKALSKLDEESAANIINTVLNTLYDHDYGYCNLLKSSTPNKTVSNLHSPCSKSGLCVSDDKVSIYTDNRKSVAPEKITYVAKMYFKCPHCGEYNNIDFPTLTKNGSIQMNNSFKNTAFQCPSCFKNIVFDFGD